MSDLSIKMDEFVNQKLFFSCQYVNIPVKKNCENKGDNTPCICTGKSIDAKQEVKTFPHAQVELFGQTFRAFSTEHDSKQIKHKEKWFEMPQNVVKELEILLDKFIVQSSEGTLFNIAPFQQFFEGDLLTFFSRISKTSNFNEDWGIDVNKSIWRCYEKLIELIAQQIAADSLPLLNLLGIVLDNESRFHLYDFIDTVSDKSYFVSHLLSHFGKVGGYENMFNRFCNSNDLNIEVGSRLLYPFIKCKNLISAHVLESCFLPIGKKLMKHLHIGENLTLEMIDTLVEPFMDDSLKFDTIDTYITPILLTISKIVNNLSDEELKNEGKNIGGDVINSIYIAARYQKERMEEELTCTRKEIILRLLRLPGSVKWNALIEINKMIDDVDRIKISKTDINSWLNANDIFNLVLEMALENDLKDCIELKKLILFKISIDNLTTKDLDNIWKMQKGKGDVFITNLKSVLVSVVPVLSMEHYKHLCSKGFRPF